MEIYSAYWAYQSHTFDNYCTDFGIKRDNNRRYGPGIRRFHSKPAHHDGDNWSALGNVAYGRGTLDIVVYYKTPGSACSYLSIYLGRNALTFRTGMGIGGNVAVFRLFMFVFSLAKALMAARDTGYDMCACVSEYPAHYRSNFHTITHLSVRRSSSSRGLSFRMAFPRCEMAFFSSAVNWATVFFRFGTKKIGS